MTVANVILWGTRIGAVLMEPGAAVASFEYDPAFVRSGIEVAPLHMPLSSRIYRFPDLDRSAFRGLPGLLADGLPDDFGNALINAWLARQGRPPGSLDAVERLCYTGSRGMGALTFEPAAGPRFDKAVQVDVAELVRLASHVLGRRASFAADLDREDATEDALTDILRVGTSAGGARAKAVIAWHPETNEVRSGQVDAPPGFEHWLLKFDGVDPGSGLADPQGFGAIEYAYSRMATRAGIDMTECRLLEEGERRHFMTRRFDRLRDGSRVHLQSLGALDHANYRQPGQYSYEQAFLAMTRLGLPASRIEDLYRRMVFNVVARNQDDHVKNISFVMDRSGNWDLSPAYDVTWAWNPSGARTAQHQMSINGRRDGFSRGDLASAARVARLPAGRWRRILKDVVDVVRTWPDIAGEAGVTRAQIDRIAASHRLDWPD